MVTTDDFLEKAPDDITTKQAGVDISGFIDEQYQLWLGKKFGQWQCRIARKSYKILC